LGGKKISAKKNNKKQNPQCALCSIKNRACEVKDGSGPAFCPTLDNKDTKKFVKNEYKKPDIREFAREASIQEAECYSNRNIKPYVLHPVKPRVQEICEFANKMSYKKLGIAFCSGLRNEALVLTKIFKHQGFEVVSVVCKVGCMPKEDLGLKEEEKIMIGEFESMCNPIMQAAVLNQEKTDFNIIVGLCVGHDSLFFKYSEALTTVLIAKDRVLGHNPAGAIYTTESYYARLIKTDLF